MPTSDPYAERPDALFPKLDSAQIQRVSRVAHRRSVREGEILIEAGAGDSPFFVVLSGAIEIVRRDRAGDEIIAVHGPGQFTGELNMLANMRSMFRARVRSAGEVLELDQDGLRHLVQADAELGELLMRAYILRRVALIVRHQGNVQIVGSSHSADTLRLREFLTRNSQPHAYLDVDRDPAVQPLFDRFHVRASDIPLVICRNESLLRNPSNQRLAECIGMNPSVDATRVHDALIVGAGPAGLAAAVYAASEGLDVLVIESNAPGGQAGASSKIENYLGFPTGISGQALAGRAQAQVQKFGAEVLVARDAAKLDCAGTPYAVELVDGTRMLARAIVIATGVRYRRPSIPDLERFEGNGVYYGATAMEGALCSGEEVIVVGGGNSAGQAAIFLSKSAERVQMLVRSGGLAQSMSRYLIARIEQTPTIALRTFTQIEALEGGDELERVRIRDSRTGQVETRPVRHVFMMTGADPNTAWLAGCVARDERGFVKTGSELSAADLQRWPLARAPYMFETTIPGVFAVGDVRSGSVKRVASAVGEGSVCVQLMHRVLAER